MCFTEATVATSPNATTIVGIRVIVVIPIAIALVEHYPIAISGRIGNA